MILIQIGISCKILRLLYTMKLLMRLTFLICSLVTKKNNKKKEMEMCRVSCSKNKIRKLQKQNQPELVLHISQTLHVLSVQGYLIK